MGVKGKRGKAMTVATQANGTAATVIAVPPPPPSYPPDERWELDMNGIKRKDMKAFNEDFKAAQDSNDDELLHKWLAKVIKRWPYALDPSDPESYMELGLADYREAAGRFGDAFRIFTG